jgi:hypothetical protein
MAARKGDPVGGGEKHGTIEIAYVKLSGNDTTLQKAVDAFTTLIKQQSGNARVLVAKPVNALNGATSNGHSTEADATEEEAIEVEAQESEQPEEAASTPKTTRKFAPPVALSIDTNTKVSLDDFVKQYKLESNEDKYLAVAAWMKAQHPGTAVKAGHIVTIFKHLDWTLPKDVAFPFRRLVSKNFQWLERVGSGDYQIHQVGESKLAKLKI